jgi:hypothetical protein
MTVPHREIFLVTVLLAAHYGLAFWAVSGTCTTVDELAHMTAGVSYWMNDDYRLQPENGNLPQRWCSLPLVIAGWNRLPPADDPGWATSDVWSLGRRYFYGLGQPAERMLAASRAAAAAWGVGTCLVVWLWSRSLFGVTGGLLSLVVAATDPTLLAHAPLATSDMCAACLLIATTWLVWRLAHEVSTGRLAAAAAAAAALAVAKASALLLLPIVAVMLAARVVVGPPPVVAARGRRRPFGGRVAWIVAAGCAAAILATVWLTIWAAFGFRYTGMNPATLPPGGYAMTGTLAGALEGVSGVKHAAIAAAARLRLLPEAFLYGLVHVFALLGRLAFLRGEYSVTGWWHYFPYAFLVKTPLTTLVAAAAAIGRLAIAGGAIPAGERAGAAAGAPRPLPGWYPLVPLAAIWIVVWAAAIATPLNIGHRHILPVYPLLFIVIGSLATGWRSPRSGPLVAGLVACGSLAACGAGFPHYLAFFNGLVSRRAAHRHLVDSNLDWGQDLPGLARWLAGRPPGDDRPVYLAYFGNGSPARLGIEAVPLGLPEPAALRPGWYAVSASVLEGVYRARPWTAALEGEYRGLVAGYRRLRDSRPGDPAFPPNLGRRLGHLQYLRLLGHLRDREPEADIGGSILLFAVTAADLDRYLAGPSPRQFEVSAIPAEAFD